MRYSRVLAFLLCLLWTIPAFAANKYWVGGTGNLSDTTNHIAASSGGLPGSTLSAGDSLIFDTLSNATGYTATLDTATPALTNLTIGAPLTGTVTIAGSGAININGNYSVAASGVSFTNTGDYTFAGSAGGTIDTNGVNLNGANINIAPVSTVSWQLLSDLNQYSGSRFRGSFTCGANCSFDWNGKTHTVAAFTINGAAGSRTITFGAATVTATFGAFTFKPTGSVGSFTFNAGTSTANIPSNTFSGSLDISTVPETWYNFVLAGGNTVDNSAISWKIAGCTFHAITFNTTGGQSFFLVDGGFTTASLTTGGSGGTNRIIIGNGTPGTPATITVTSSFSLAYSDFMDITAAGAAGTWTGTSLGDWQGNSNITFDTPRNLFYIDDGGHAWTTSTNWSLTSGGTANQTMPLAQDNVRFDGNSGSSITVSILAAGPCKNLITTGWTGALDVVASRFRVFGNLTLSATTTITNNWTALIFAGRAGQTITTNGVDQNASVIYFWSAPSDAYTLQDALTATGGTLILFTGTLDDNGKSITAAAWNNSGSLTREFKGSATDILTGSGTVYTTATNTGLTQSNFLGTFKFTNSSSTNKTIATGGFNASTTSLWNNTGSTGQFRTTGSGTFKDLKLDAGRDWHPTAGTNTTLTTLTMPASGSNAITIDSITAATHTISVTSGTIRIYGTTISHSIATGGATFLAYTSDTNVDGGNNTGWQFSASNNRKNLPLMGVGMLDKPANDNEKLAANDNVPVIRLVAGRP